MAANENTAIVILAAGSSSRLGRPKQLLVYRGKNLLQHVVSEALALKAGPVLVVLGAQSAELKTYCSGTIIIVNEGWQEGMASSIRAGVQVLQEKFPGIEGCILAVCDQPYLDSGIFQQLRDTHIKSGKPIVAAAYNNDTLGTPVYFHRMFFPELLALTGDKGARLLLQTHQSEVSHIPFQDGRIDIDTEKDVERLNWE